MPSRFSRTASAPAVAAGAVTFDDNPAVNECLSGASGLPAVSSAAAYSAMEEGGTGGGETNQRQHQHQQQQQQQEEDGGGSLSRVLVAAAEARDQEGESRRRLAHSYRCIAEVLSILLLVLVAAFASVFIYAWVDAFSEVRRRRTHTTAFVSAVGVSHV